jgi:hypothetical protein
MMWQQNIASTHNYYDVKMDYEIMCTCNTKFEVFICIVITIAID